MGGGVGVLGSLGVLETSVERSTIGDKVSKGQIEKEGLGTVR